MQMQETRLRGVKKIFPSVYLDSRGFFYESYRRPLYSALGIDYHFEQDNHSYSVQGTLRGMHFQSHPGQAKLITVITGAIYDVFVDIRKDSPTFGQWEAVVLDSADKIQLLLPEGFAHGFCVLSPEAHIMYKVSSIYDPTTEKSFRYDDPKIGIQWPSGQKIVSDRDLCAPSFEEALA